MQEERGASEANEEDAFLESAEVGVRGRGQPEAGSAETCPSCGRKLRAGHPRFASSRPRLYAAGLVLVAAAVALVVVLTQGSDHNTHASAVARLAEREEIEEDASRVKKTERILVADILRDARRQYALGKLGGPSIGATCTPINEPPPGTLGPAIRKYDCIAIQRRRPREIEGVRSVTLEGARYFGTITVQNGHFTFGGD